MVYPASPELGQYHPVICGRPGPPKSEFNEISTVRSKDVVSPSHDGTHLPPHPPRPHLCSSVSPPRHKVLYLVLQALIRYYGCQSPLTLILWLLDLDVQISHEEDLRPFWASHQGLFQPSHHWMVVGWYIRHHHLPTSSLLRNGKTYHFWAVIVCSL